MSRPKNRNRLGIRCIHLFGFSVGEKIKQLNSAPREVYYALVDAFRTYLSHFYVDLPEDITIFDLLRELDYWRIDSFQYILTDYGVTIWLSTGRFEYKSKNNSYGL